MIISANLIVKNESAHLAKCLESIQSICDEIIVVDTGSTDDTVEIAKAYTDKVYAFPWCNDYSAARNEALRHTTGDWILIIDGDMSLDVHALPLIQNAVCTLPSNEPTVVMFHLLTPGEQPLFVRGLFPNHLGICFKGRVHEWPALNGRWIKGIEYPGLQAFHEMPDNKRKLPIYRQLILQSLAEAKLDEEHVHWLYHLGLTDLKLGNFQKALDAFNEARIHFLKANWDRRQRLYHNLLVPLTRLTILLKDEMDKAGELSFELVTYFPDFGEGWLYHGYCQFWSGEMKLAKKAYSHALHLTQKMNLPLEVQKRSNFQAQVGLARISLLDGNTTNGSASLQTLYRQRPQPELAWHLCRTYLLTKEFSQASKWYEVASGQSRPLNVEEIIKALRLLPIWSPLEEGTLKNFEHTVA